jgi:lysophospholipase L1-like esterase
MEHITRRALLKTGLGLLCLGAPAIRGASNQANAGQPALRGEYLKDISRQLTLQWPKNHTINIVCHGHSVPAGYFKTPVVEALNAYPHLLREGLQKRFPFAVFNVIVTAIGGENAVQGAARFEHDVLALHPDVVTIDYALNDRRIGLEKARAAWSTMIEQARAQGSKVILLTPTGDLKARLDDPNDPLNRHAAQIRELAAHYQVGLVDSLEAFKQYQRGGGKLDTLMAQPNHPNRKGHELVAAELLKWFL